MTPQSPDPRDAATLERLYEDAKWSKYDSPSKERINARSVEAELFNLSRSA